MIKSFSDDLAQYNGDGYVSSTILARDQFVVFRFCASDYCSDSKVYGCSEDYGEYILPLADYLTAMSTYTAERTAKYCNYCENCLGYNNGNRRLANADDAAAGDDAAAAGDDAGQAAAADDAVAAADDGGQQAAADDGGQQAAADDGGQQAAADDGNAAAQGDDAAAADAGDDAGQANAADDGGQQAAANDDAVQQGDDAAQQQNADDNAAAATDDQNDATSTACADACSSYDSKCANDNAVDYSNYLQCVEFQDDSGDVYYIGPQCSWDGKSIVISVFKDQYCNEVMDSTNAANVTGIAFEDDGLADYYQSSCISCKESELPWEELDEDADADTVSEICETLYYESGKCNKNYKNFDSGVYGGYGSGGLEQSVTDELVCSYIQNVLSGYDESGEIYTGSSFFKSNSARANEFTQPTVTPGQVFGIIFSVVACVGLAGYSCFLHRAIMKKAPWRPNRGGVAALAGQISRQNSGIVIGRSRSSGSQLSPGGSLA